MRVSMLVTVALTWYQKKLAQDPPLSPSSVMSVLKMPCRMSVARVCIPEMLTGLNRTLSMSVYAFCIR